MRPRPLTIDLANPKAGMEGLTKKDKKDWKQIQKEKRKNLRLQNKLYDFKIDSAQLANYEKYKAMKNPDANALKQLAKSQLPMDSLPFNVPDSVDLTQLNDSAYFESLSPAVKEQLANELAMYMTDYNDISPDSLKKVKALYFDSLSNSNDSTAAIIKAKRNEMLAKYSNDALESKGQEQLSNYGPTSELGAYQQQEEMMFSSYDEMIASDKYQKLMASMPGKKAEIESFSKSPKIDEDDLPIPESVFAGNEDKLKNALTANTVVGQRPSFKDWIKEFFNQDMESVQQKSLIQRFSLTGQIQFSNYDPLFIDYSPSITYALTSKIGIGTGVTGRAKIGEGEDDKDNLFGYRGFVEYDILKNIFLHGEYERTGLMVTDPTTELEARQWTDRWLLGLGTDIQMPGLLNGTLMILYNFDDDIANSPNPRRFQVRYGVKIN